MIITTIYWPISRLHGITFCQYRALRGSEEILSAYETENRNCFQFLSENNASKRKRFYEVIVDEAEKTDALMFSTRR